MAGGGGRRTGWTGAGRGARLHGAQGRPASAVPAPRIHARGAAPLPAPCRQECSADRAAAFYIGAVRMQAVGLRTNAFIVAPLAVFAAIVFGFAVYNTVCKNSHINLLSC